jgi:hypothetical protein
MPVLSQKTTNAVEEWVYSVNSASDLALAENQRSQLQTRVLHPLLLSTRATKTASSALFNTTHQQVGTQFTSLLLY